LTIVAFEQGRIDGERPAVVQRLAAVGRARRWPPPLPSPESGVLGELPQAGTKRRKSSSRIG
jgi:hypothetical protein